METLERERDLHQRRADRRRRRVVGRHDTRSRRRISPTGRDNPGRRGCGRKAAHPNARFTVVGDCNARRSTPSGTTPRACRFRHSSSAPGAAIPCRSLSKRRVGKMGVYKAATMGSETTAAAAGKVGEVASRSVRRCCRSAAITSATISRTGSRWARTVAHPPRIFQRQLVPHT